MSLLWCDLETTGLDPRKNRIIEVAWTITNDDLSPLLTGIKSHVVTADLETLDQLDEFNEQFDMHIKSGLTDDVHRSELTLLLDDIEDHMLFDLEATGSEKPILAGSGVHFDQRFIQEWMPRLADKLHYRVFDTSTLGRFFKDCIGVEFPVTNDNPHRAANDVQEALSRARMQAQYVNGIRIMGEQAYTEIFKGVAL